jgi:hypothetical protein
VPLATPLRAKAKTRAKARRVKPTPAQAAEQKLLTAMRQNPGLSVIALANAAGSGRSATGERLRQMALRGVVEKDLAGRWKLREEARTAGGIAPYAAAVELTAEEKPQPAVTHAPWIRPIGDYERRETTIVEGLRYG